MKKHGTIVGLTAVMIVLCASSVAAQYVFGPNGPIPLREDSSRLLIKFEVTFSPQDQEALLSELASVLRPVSDDHVRDGFLACSLYIPQSTMQLSDSLRLLRGVYLAEPYYLAPNDSPLIAGEAFFVAFNSGVPRASIDSTVAAYGVLVDEEMQGMPNVFLLRNTKRSGYSLLDIANIFHQMDITAFGRPNFNCPIVKSSYTVLDYYNSYQLHLKKVIGSFNQASVWDFAGLSRPATVAVIDDGINWQGLSVHDDLPASRILPGWDFNASTDTSDTNWWDDDPSPGLYQAHGMGCAGIIAASHTTDTTELETYWQTTGIFGLNPKVSILPVKIFNDSGNAGAATDWDVAAAIVFAYDRAEVLSNSWGYGYPYPIGFFPLLDSVLQQATVVGRAGKGCPVIYSAGNSGGFPNYYPTQYPAYLTWCFAVGATQLDDSLWSYSQHDSTLDVVAPSGWTGLYGDVWTLDQKWGMGFNPSYTGNPKWPITWLCGNLNNEDLDCRFGGTSAACPVASGVASLVLARDSMLTVWEVYDILRHSGVPIGSPVPNNKYGYGRVDAFRAVLSIAHGDANNDGAIDLGDLTAIIDYVLLNGDDFFPSHLLGDCNCDGLVDISDVDWIVSALFFGGPQPVKPCFQF